MANLSESAIWEPGVYRLETTDFVLGGAGGISNLQPNQLANRTLYLKGEVDTHTTQIAAIQSVNSTQTTQITNIINSLPSNLRHTVLAGCVSGGGIENALKILDGVNRIVGLDDLDPSNIGGPLHIAFSNGFRNSNYVNAEDYILYEGTSVPTASTWQIALPTGNQTRVIIAKYNTGTNVIDLDYIEPIASGGYIASVAQPVSGTIATRALWFNPATNKHKLTTDGGTSYTDVIAVLMGEVVVSAGIATTVKTYPYGKQPYDNQTPIGSVIWMASEETPLGGWLYCNGAEYNRVIYGKLFSRIGLAYGTPSGGAVFKVPDLRGQFLRGFDDGAGVDSGRVFGSSQADEIKAHAHNLTTRQTATAFATDPYLAEASGGTISTARTTQAFGGSETRPKNVAMKAWIKY